MPGRRHRSHSHQFGSIEKKIFVWKTGFCGEKGSGWHYDLIMIVMNLVILTTGGGQYVLF